MLLVLHKVVGWNAFFRFVQHDKMMPLKTWRLLEKLVQMILLAYVLMLCFKLQVDQSSVKETASFTLN